MLEEGGEHDNLICVGCWVVLPSGRVLLQHLAIKEKIARDKITNLIFVSNGWLE
jgi:hypothetical protein